MAWVTFEAVEVALQSIRAGKLRAALTMLGIIIGVAAVITMVALGTGAQRAIDERIAALGSNLLWIYPGQFHVRGVASDSGAPMTTDDALALSPRQIPRPTSCWRARNVRQALLSPPPKSH